MLNFDPKISKCVSVRYDLDVSYSKKGFGQTFLSNFIENNLKCLYIPYINSSRYKSKYFKNVTVYIKF